MSEKLQKEARRAAVDGYIDYLRRLKDVAECNEINLELARKHIEKKL